MQKDTLTGILTLIGAFCYHLAIGYFYTVGNMSPYLIAYMNISSGESVWFNSAQLAAQAIAMPLGGIMHIKFGFRLPVFLGTLFSCGGIYLSRLTVNYGLGPFIVTYCIMFGIGMGLPYSVLFAVASSWFPHRRASVVGLIAAGFGLGALIYTPIQQAIINPNNVADFNHPDIMDNVPNSFLIFASIMLGLEIVGLILCREKKEKRIEENASSFDEDDQVSVQEDTQIEISKTDDEESEINVAPVPAPLMKSYTVRQAFQCPDFYIIWCIFFLNTIPVTLQSSTFKTFGKEHVTDDQYLSAIATTCSAFNCVGRVVWGLVCDRFSFKCPMGVLLLCWGLMLGTFPFIAYTNFRVCYPIWIFILYFLLAGHFVLMPAATGRIFGPKDMSTIYGFVFSATLPSTLCLSAIVSQYDIKGHWDAVYLSCTAVCLLGFCLSLFLKDKQGTCLTASALCTHVCDPCRKDPTENVRIDESSDNEDEDDEDFDK